MVTSFHFPVTLAKHSTTALTKNINTIASQPVILIVPLTRKGRRKPRPICQQRRVITWAITGTRYAVAASSPADRGERSPLPTCVSTSLVPLGESPRSDPRGRPALSLRKGPSNCSISASEEENPLLFHPLNDCDRIATEGGPHWARWGGKEGPPPTGRTARIQGVISA